ncbi:hypothetical protein Gotur_008434 [Gossypium turneri]
MTKKKQEPGNQMDAANDHRFNIKNIMKDIQFLGICSPLSFLF